MSDDPLHGPGSLFHDPAYRMMADRVADERLAFVGYLIEHGQLDAAQAELDRAKSDLEATPDVWEWCELEALRERGTFTAEEVAAVGEEAERRRAEWLGQGGEAGEAT